MKTTTKKTPFPFSFRQALSNGPGTNVLSSVILSRLYGAHATHTWRYFPLDIHDILQKLVVPQWLQCIQFRRRRNEADD